MEGQGMNPAQQDEATELLQFLYACPVGLMEFSPRGDIYLINPLAMQLLLPLGPESFVSNFYELMEAYAPELRNMVDNFSAEQGTICEHHEILVTPGSKERGTEARVLACTIVKLTQTRLILSLTDVSKQVAEAKRLSQAETWFASLLDGINDFAVLSLDGDGIIVGVSDSMFRQSGFAAFETVGLPLDSLTAHREGFTSIGVLDQIEIAKQQGWYLSEGWQRKAHGEPYWSQRLISMRNDAHPGSTGCGGFAVVIRDVTKHDADTTALLRMLKKDYLTGAFNRAHFFETGEAECLRAERYGLPLGLIAIDIDHFKNINDEYGHAAGDLALVRFAETCMAVLRPNDIFARLGGEEFVVLLPSTDGEGAIHTAERLRAALAAMTIQTDHRTISITASFGCAQMQPQASNLAALLAEADRSLYQAKRSGRNRVEAAWTTEVVA
jgi:diguanylate cyclase (GGDEF)-like protein